MEKRLDGMETWLAADAVADAAGASGKRQVLNALAEIAARAYGLPAAAVAAALAEREAAGSTGVGHGVAAPHAAVPGLPGLRAVFLRLASPVDFDAVDGRPVDLLFALFAPPGAGSEHLRALARVSRVLRRPDVREQLRQARSADAIRVLLTREAQPSAAA